MEHASKSSSVAASGRIRWAGFFAIIVGFIAFVLAIGFEVRGFGGGLVMGAGIGAAAVGAYFWGYANGLRRADDERLNWLPSQDAQE